MEAEKDKLQNYFNSQPVKSTSGQFTDNVMQKVQALAEKPFEVKPLISKKAWWRILAMAAFLIGASTLLDFAKSIQKMPTIIDFSAINWQDFKSSLKLGLGVIVLLSILTLVDIVYRKVRSR